MQTLYAVRTHFTLPPSLWGLGLTPGHKLTPEQVGQPWIRSGQGLAACVQTVDHHSSVRRACTSRQLTHLEMPMWSANLCAWPACTPTFNNR
jgi:hypothetical protein